MENHEEKEKMRRDYREGIQRARHSIWYNLSRLSGKRNAPRDYFSSPQTHMLIQDTAGGIMPISGRSQRTSFRTAVSSSDQKVASLVETAIARHRRSHGLADAACDFFHDCAQIILAYEKAIYEIVFPSRDIR